MRLSFSYIKDFSFFPFFLCRDRFFDTREEEAASEDGTGERERELIIYHNISTEEGEKKHIIYSLSITDAGSSRRVS